MKKKIRKYYDQLYAYTFENLNERNYLKMKISMLSQEEIY